MLRIGPKHKESWFHWRRWFAYGRLSQQEDPKIPERRAVLVTHFPGATAAKVEHLVTKKLERKISELSSLDEMTSESRAGVSIIHITLQFTGAQQIEQQWDKLRAKLAEVELPVGCGDPWLNTDFGNTVTLLLGIVSPPLSEAECLARARLIRSRLREHRAGLPEDGTNRAAIAVFFPPAVSASYIDLVSRRFQDDLSRQAWAKDVLFSLATITGYEMTSIGVLNAIAARNALIPSGTFRSGGHNFSVQLSGEFHHEDELLSAIVGMTTNGPVYLRDIFEVRRGYENPIPFSVDVLKRDSPRGPLASRRAVMLAVEMKDGQVISKFNREVQRAIDVQRRLLPDGIEIATVSDQPRAVAQRLSTFMACLGEAIAIVVGVALILMEWRSAVVVAIAIPLTIAMLLIGMQLTGVALQQISIASMILALGMLVDDPVVATDGINRELAHGHPRDRAAWLGPYRLRRPIFFATIINIVAFLPLVLLPDDKGAFIFSLPVVATLALAASRLVSMTFVPFLGYYLLRGQKGFESGSQIRSLPLLGWVDHALQVLLPKYRGFLTWALDHPWRVAVPAYALLALSFGLTPFLGQQFFPPAERNQLLVDVELPESASINQTRHTCQEISALLKDYNEIASAALFVGGSAPRFYYNVEPREPGEHLAQILINTFQSSQIVPLMASLRRELDHRIAGARCIVKQLEVAGEAKELANSQREMGLVMVVSLGLIFLTMVAQFSSVMKSVVVMSTVPLGLIGAFLGLAITGSALGFMALLGIVSLAGVVVSHIIVLSDFIEEARAQGVELKTALVQAGLVRLRAVLVTVLATVGGLIPLAMKGGELWKPLTAVHIFGLLLAAGLTLVMLPVLYFISCSYLKLIKWCE